MTLGQQRLRSGIDGLDDLLYGGFLEGDTVLLAGAPGSGKTSLGLQFLYNGATKHGQPGLLVTFEEFPQRIYRDAANFGWDLQQLERENRLKVIFTSPDFLQQDLLQEEGLFAEMVREIGARRIVVDSISLFESHLSVHGNRREAVYGLMNALKREELTALLIREMSGEHDIGSAAEDYVADGVIVLTQERVEGQRVRFLEVMKSRGTPHMPYRAMMLMGSQGIRVIPAHRDAFFHFEEAMSTGISALDDLLGGGIPYGAHYLVEIGSDFHSQIIEANFMREGIEAGDIWIQIGGSGTLRRELEAPLAGLGISPEVVAEARRAGRLRILGPVTPSGDTPETFSAEEVLNTVEDACSHTLGGQRVRIGMELSSLVISLGRDLLLSLLSRLMGLSQCNGGVILGIIQTGLMGDQSIEQVRSLADGIIRIWKDGDFDYLQVLKTINSVRTRVQAVLESPEPPYIQIVS